jgi:hypothetical protein
VLVGFGRNKSLAYKACDGGPHVCLPLHHCGKPALLEVSLEVRSSPLLEGEQLGDQAPEALLERVSFGKDLRGVLQRRGPEDSVRQLGAHEALGSPDALPGFL